MKSIKLYFVLSVMAVITVVVSCNKDIDSSEGLAPFAPAQLDENAGTWTLIPSGPMTTVDQIAVPAPAAENSTGYLNELDAVKVAQSKLTDDQKKIIDYWASGGVLRWNQILRELVARYNLPPAPKADGSYVTPDAENPFGDPAFPFSNPPYAARAYSYVTAAQYEAMMATWHYKYLYNRKAAYDNDPGVQALVPKTTLPAYPSEDAVLSGVSADLLKVLFPAAHEEITKMAFEQRQAALWSGKAVQSDVTAGLALGKSIAALFLARAANDNMRFAVGSSYQWTTFTTKATAAGEIPWSSLEIPPRPPMLPYFSNVRAWMMTPTDIVNERPGAPPSTTSTEMADEVNEVKYYSDNLTRERIAIVHKWADGVGTYTPPGHWNDIAEEYVRDAHFSEVRAARAFAMINMALHDAAVGCWETKYFYFNPRPTQMDPSIKTGTGIPNFPAYTSGHSTFSGAAATVLSYLFPEHTDYFMKEADEASLSRLYGAIHYRTDIEIGLDHGMVIGGYTVNFASADGAD